MVESVGEGIGIYLAPRARSSRFVERLRRNQNLDEALAQGPYLPEGSHRIPLTLAVRRLNGRVLISFGTIGSRLQKS